MRIAIDGRELCGRATGVGRYLSRLLTEWAHLPQAARHQFTIYVPDVLPGFSRAGDALPGFSRANANIRHVAGGSGTVWEQLRLPLALKHDRPDLLFAPGYTAPLFTRIPTVVTIHDLSFAAHPEWFSWREGLRRRWLTRQTAHRARAILTDTEFSKREIVERLGIEPRRVTVIPLGIDLPASSAPALVAPFDGAQGRREPLVLFVGSIFNRRHVPELITTFRDVADRLPGARLAIVGDNRTHPREDLSALVGRLQLGDRVALRSFVSDAELADLYRRASAFVFLSEYEGFGLTPLEALAAGVPIVVLDTPVAREVYGDAAHYVRKGDIAAVSAAIATFLTGEEARQAAIARAANVLARYSWERTAGETLAVLESAAGGH